MSSEANGIVIMIESPYSGDIDRNIRYLNIAMAESAVKYGECPYASHSYMTQHPRKKDFFVSDYDKKWDMLSREGAIERSQIMRKRCDKTVFYTDRGWSTGMKCAKKYCQENNLPFEERVVNTSELAKRIPFLSEEFCKAVINNDSYEEYFME